MAPENKNKQKKRGKKKEREKKSFVKLLIPKRLTSYLKWDPIPSFMLWATYTEDRLPSMYCEKLSC